MFAVRGVTGHLHDDGVFGHVLAVVCAERNPGDPGAEPAQVRALLASCDLGTAGGRRDLAMMTLLARMGLRAGEVAGLRLDDIDWRRGEITIAGKGNRRDQLPLPADAGEAVADWLQQGRPPTALDRSVFIRVKTPHRGLTAGGSRWLCSRPGSGPGWARSTRTGCGTFAATAMLAEGGSLAEIGHQRSASRRCARSPAHGREPRRDRAAPGAGAATWTCAADWGSSWTATPSLA